MDITVLELKSRLDNGENIALIDVREPYEFEEFNIGAQLIPLGTLPAKLEELEELKDREIIVHCRSGMRSASAQQLMRANGFSNVRNLIGGMLDWQKNFG